MGKQRREQSQDSIFVDNPFVDGFLEWMGSREGRQCIELRDVLWDLLEDAELDAETERWCGELMERSPTALTIAKRAFNADTESIRGISGLGMQTVSLYYNSEESKEGNRAFREKRKPEFRKYRAG